MNTTSIQARITSSRVTNTTVLFLLAAPIVVFLYCLFIFNPLNAHNSILYILQVVADSISILVLMSLWLTILMDVLIAPHHRVMQPEHNGFLLKSKPTIDILITVAGEPLEIIKETLVAVVAMNYPHGIFVLDDGGSSIVEQMALKAGAHYIHRPTRDFAKSGNLNYGLQFSKAEFFVILDADQVPKKHFIETLLPYMEDPEIGMVQSPQHFNNIDNFIAHGTAQAQDIFYQHICPAKNLSNSAFCVGTNVVFRRSAIDEIGGIAQTGHSEDIWTSLKLHEKKWKTLFVNEILAVGKAPETIVSFFKQQLRWAKGGLKMLFFNNPLASENLTLDQRLQYFTANTFYLVGFAMLVYLMSPILYLLFNIEAFRTDSGLTWMAHYLPYFALYYSLTWLLLGELHISTIATSLASFYPYLRAFVGVVLGTKHTWIATTSRRNSADSVMQWIWPHVFIVILTIFALIVGWSDPQNIWTTTFNSMWALFNMYLLLIFITSAKRKVIVKK